MCSIQQYRADMSSMRESSPRIKTSIQEDPCHYEHALQVLPSMQQRKQGTIVFTGATASLRGGAGFSCLAVGKFGLRALAQSLARENQKDNSIHVAHVIIDGMVDLPRTRGWFPDKPTEDFLNPHAIAQEYWNLYNQHPSTWTLELDLRPHPEKF
eukprot:TRINITY_DN6043_c0_g1_i1.p1 TRINITY_DN6043_c0_g1~~TRINITY_DN6043_c0_g1_i1.p1  ORF type:complete len:155 (+),score=21.56 TRINITY_DN6043_c0_g1_i1:494-958(+)